jgi:chromosomal replication initiation ATPase DnaA
VLLEKVWAVRGAGGSAVAMGCEDDERGVRELWRSAPAGRVEQDVPGLKRELGEATFGSWLGQAALRESGDEVCLVAATGVARDWIRRHAWRAIGELWAQNDPLGRRLDLKSRMEVESTGAAVQRRADRGAGWPPMRRPRRRFSRSRLTPRRPPP